jgi:hypothetical protein
MQQTDSGRARLHSCRKPAQKARYAQPWKSGASAPRPAQERKRASAPVDVFPDRIPRSHPSDDLATPRPGRARPQSVPQARVKDRAACTTVEERRFSTASSAPKRTGLQPQWTFFPRVLHVSRLLRDVGLHGPIALRIWERHDREGHDFSRAASPQKRNRSSRNSHPRNTGRERSQTSQHP